MSQGEKQGSESCSQPRRDCRERLQGPPAPWDRLPKLHERPGHSPPRLRRDSAAPSPSHSFLPVHSASDRAIDDMPSQVGRQARGRRGGGGARATSAAPPSSVPDVTRLPRGSRETAMLLRANGFGVLNGEKLRRHAAADPALRKEPARVNRRNQERPRQADKPEQQQQTAAPPRRQVRLMEPAQQQQQQAPARPRKRKHASVSEVSSEEERSAAAARPARSQQLAQPTQSQQTQGGGMKRVRSSWKMRPLLIGGCCLLMGAGGRQPTTSPSPPCRLTLSPAGRACSRLGL